MPGGSRKVVYAAIATNAAVAVTKFLVAALSGSAAMLAEGFHSAADTGNEILLLIGMKRSARPATEQHPFGHGRELYFWAFVVAMSIFSVGGGLSIYEGVLRLLHPQPLESAKWSYVVLAIAAALEGSSWVIGVRELRRRRSQGSLMQAVQDSKDPSVFTVVVEDSAALIGLALAFLGIFLSHLFQQPWIDATASVLIGLLLVAAAGLLAYETGGLLVGESVDRGTLEKLRQTIAGDPAVQKLGNVLTMQLGPHEILLAADVSFQPQLGTRELEEAIDRIERAVQNEHPGIKHLYFEAERIGGKTPDESQAA